MTGSTRRRYLRAVAGASSLPLAGCSGLLGGSAEARIVSTANAVVNLADGYALAGTHRDRAWMCRLNGDGTVRWHVALPGEDRQRVSDLAANADGFVLTGSYYRHFESENVVWIAKVDPEGSLSWERTPWRTGDVYPQNPGVAARSDEYVLSSGNTVDGGGFTREYVSVAAFAPDGSYRWQWDSDETLSRSRSVAVDGSSYAVLAHFDSDYDSGFAIVRLAGTGPTDSTVTYTRVRDDFVPWHLAPLPQRDSAYAVSYVKDTVNRAIGTIGAAAVDGDGIRWSKGLTGRVAMHGGIAASPSGPILVCGDTAPNADPRADDEPFRPKRTWSRYLAANGRREDHAHIGEGRRKAAWRDATVAGDGGFLLGGVRGLGDGTAAAWVVKYTADAEKQWSRTYKPDSVNVPT